MKLIIGGVCIGLSLVTAAAIRFTVSDHPFLFPASYLLEKENNILRAEIQGAVSAMEMLDLDLLQIHDQDARLNILLRYPLSAADSISRARVFSDRISE